jgi:hypothetical protein
MAGGEPVSIVHGGCGRCRKLVRFSARGSPTGFSYVLAEGGLKLRVRIKRPEIGGRIRTFFGTRTSARRTYRNSIRSGLARAK